MKSLSELAAIYDRWAEANELFAEQILSHLDSLPHNSKEQQRWRASHLMAEAAALKSRAEGLRDLEDGVVELVHDGYKVPQDRNLGCDGPPTIWRHKGRR